MRRTFSEDTLYWKVFQEYMHQLVTVYHTGVEFFIEGTRSRSFKALPPKIGLLSMALEPLFMGELPDITIVPIGVAYERPLEEQLFAYEMLGVPKPKESTMALFKALKILDINHGSMYINFGQPISAREYFGSGLQRFEHAQYPVHVQHLTKPELAMITDISQNVCDFFDGLFWIIFDFYILDCGPAAATYRINHLQCYLRLLQLPDVYWWDDTFGAAYER